MFDNLEPKKENNQGGISPQNLGHSLSNQNPGGAKKENIASQKVDDMFAGVADVKPPLPKPGSGIPTETDKEMRVKSSSGAVKTLLFVMVLLIVIAISIVVFSKIFGFPSIDSIKFKTEKTPEVGTEIPKTPVAPVPVEAIPPDDNIDISEPTDIPAEEERLPIGGGAETSTDPQIPAIEDTILDTDGDGMTDEEEILVGTDINKSDTDGDGFSDKEEFLEYKTNPMEVDTDKDGLSDYEEIMIYKTDPNNSDTDGDTYLDGSEVANGYNPAGEGKLE